MKPQNERTNEMNKTTIRRPVEPSSSNVAIGVGCWYDEDREGWRFQGLGFDFITEWVGDGSVECDCVKREGDESFSLHLHIDSSNIKLTADIFASIVVRELDEYWGIRRHIVFQRA